MKKSYLLILGIALLLMSRTAYAYCGGNYNGGDWIVNTTIACSDEEIPLDGYLKVTNESLTLDNVTLKVISFSEGEHGINASKGRLFIYNSKITNYIGCAGNAKPCNSSDFNEDWKCGNQTGCTWDTALNCTGTVKSCLDFQDQDNCSTQSGCSWEENGHNFYFIVNYGAVFEMENTELHNCGWSDSEPYRGLEIYTGETNLLQNKITGNFYGVILHYPYSFRNLVSGNNISYNARDGVVVLSENNSLLNNTISNNLNGIRVINTVNNTIYGNDIFSNQNGTYVQGQKNKILSNKISANMETGLFILGDNNIITYNELLNNEDFGIYLKNSASTQIISNTANFSKKYDIYLLSSKNTLLQNNTYTSLIRFWLLDVNVTDSSNQSIFNATVKIQDKFNSTIFEGLTDSYGKIPQRTIREYEEDKSKSSSISYTPHRINASKFALETTSAIVNINDDTSLQIALFGKIFTYPLVLYMASPQNTTYLQDDLINQSFLQVVVFSNLNLSSCYYSINSGTSVSMNSVTTKQFEQYINVTAMTKGSKNIKATCMTPEGQTNSTELLWFITYPSYACLADSDCADYQNCSQTQHQCEDVKCGYCKHAENHACVSDGECCLDTDCEDNKYCDIAETPHACKDVACDCGIRSNHKCTIPFVGYCCWTEMCCQGTPDCIQICDLDQAHTNTVNRCINRSLNLALPSDIMQWQNITVSVADQNGDPVSNVMVTVRYESGDNSTDYTDANGTVNIFIKEPGNVNIVARKAGYAVGYNVAEVKPGFDWLFVLPVIIVIILVPVIFFLFRYLRSGGAAGPIKMEKTISGGFVMLKIKNKTDEVLSDVLVTDQVPRGAFIRCNIMPVIKRYPNYIDNLVWHLLELGPNEEVVIEYEATETGEGFTVRAGDEEYSI